MKKKLFHQRIGKECIHLGDDLKRYLYRSYDKKLIKCYLESFHLMIDSYINKRFETPGYLLGNLTCRVHKITKEIRTLSIKK